MVPPTQPDREELQGAEGGQAEGGAEEDEEGEEGADLLAAGQVGRGLLFPVASQNPAVVEACTKAQMAVLGLVPTTTGHPPPHTMFVPPSVPGLPPVVRDPFGVPRQQGGPQATSSGGDQGRPTGPVRRSSRGGGQQNPPFLSPPTPVVGLPRGRPLPLVKNCPPGSRSSRGNISSGALQTSS